MMKTISSCAVLLLMCYFVQSAPSSEPVQKKDAKAISWRCAFSREYVKTKFDYTKYYGENLEKMDEKTAYKCFLACNMEELGEINPDGTINTSYSPDEAIIARQFSFGSEEAKNKYKEAHLECAKVGKAGGNKCEIAAALYHCMEEKEKKSAPTSEPVENKKDVKAIFWRCAFPQYWATKFDYLKYYGDSPPKDEKIGHKCYMACAMEDFGAMNPDGTINVDNAEDLWNHKKTITEEERNKVKEAFLQCSKLGKAGGNKCEIAGAIFDCLKAIKVENQKKEEAKQQV